MQTDARACLFYADASVDNVEYLHRVAHRSRKEKPYDKKFSRFQ